MSEYQYYEFRAIDRSLNQAEKEAVSRLSSRAQVTSTQAVFTYSHRDLHNPEEILAKYFDAMFYIANWGTMQLMFRFPKESIELERMRRYCVNSCIEVAESKKFVILNFEINIEEGFGWIEGEGYLSSLIDTRQEILQGDYRLLYLAWLKAITCSEVEVDPKEVEPPVPNNLGKLSLGLQAFVDTFAIDQHLLKIAITESKTSSISEKQLKSAINQLTAEEKDTFLLKLVKGESNLSFELRNKLLEILGASHSSSQGKRTIQQLLESAQQERRQAERKERQAQEAKRIQELEVLAQQQDSTWQTVDSLIQKGQAKSYDEAVQLLLKLRELAEFQNLYSNFQTRFEQLLNKYRTRPGLKTRLIQVNLI